MVLANDGREQETLMEVAERYLEELAKRCMVQVELHEEGQPAITRFKLCWLHDLIRDLCLDKAKEENLYKAIDFGHQNIGFPSTNSSSAIERHYGFVVRSFGNEIDKHIPQTNKQTKHLRSSYDLPENYIEQAKHLRSLICEVPLDLSSPFISRVNKFKMLRVLVIVSYDLAYQLRYGYCKSPLKCIGHLIHLRYLSLRNSKIWKLPSSLGNLNYLETMDLSGTECYRITHVLGKLGHVRYLYLPYSDRKLRLDRLDQLEILESVTNKNCDLKDLSKLTNLRALKVRVYENLEDVEQIIHHISSMNYMRFSSLQIWDCDFGINSISHNNKGLAVLEKLLFCTNLHELKIYGTLCKQLPNYQPHLFPSSNLTQLHLSRCNIEEDPMPTLEKFPKLRRLYFGTDSFVGKEMICHAMGFPQLKVLEFSGLKNLEKWEVEEGSMPKLSSLRISYCEKLEMIPDGLRSITSLSEITLARMPEEFRNRVQVVNGKKGPDFDKIRHVPSVIVKY